MLDENGNLVEHNCSVPLGTSILFPILNVACNTNDAPPFFGANEHEQRECSKGFIDKAFDLQVIIDGKELKHPEQYRLASPKADLNLTQQTLIHLSHLLVTALEYLMASGY